ncbi:MAG TPA: glycoside hydrolase family 140 protein [Trichocoleus sp.]|jgi:hypothetical protein
MSQAFARRTFLRFILAVCGSKLVSSCANTTQFRRLTVAPNKRFLLDAARQPFFYLGDTAWELFHRLNREEAILYLQDRARKGFTVIQAVVLAELDGLGQPNPFGDVPLKQNDPTQPNEAYFRHVDFIVDEAEKRGLFIGMLPTWGDKWNKRQGIGPEIFTPDNAATFGEYLGKRYQNKPIIWILGGDRSPEDERHPAIIRAMARGLKKGDGGNHLITFHPMGGTNSATWFHNDDWLDFNMFQSGHSAPNIPNYETVTANYALTPIKPTLDGEPCYEDHPIEWNPQNGWFDQADVRKAAYWSMLAGACGHTYGNHNIWQMWQPGRSPISSARTPWQEALQHPGATQMGYLRQLFESRAFTKLVPDQSLLVNDTGEGGDRIQAARAEDGSFGFIYTPTGMPFTVNLEKMRGNSVSAYWYDPRQGTRTAVDEVPTTNFQEFTPPSRGRGNDWILGLDSDTLS